MINSFKSYLVEEEKTLYFVWGRMNPPTAGHEKLLDFLKTKAGNNPYRIYLTQSEDQTKNPIPFVQKVKFARKGFPQYARQIMMDRKLKTIFDAVTSFYNEGFKRIVVVAGGDRIREYEITLNKYNGVKGRHGFYNFEKIQVLNAGNRDPDSEGVAGVSGTKLRGFVKDGDFTSFAQNMPKKLSNADAKQVFNAVRKGMGLKEQKEFKNHVQLDSVSSMREAYVSGNLLNEGDMVIVKDTDEVATVRMLGANYVIVEDSMGKKFRKWIDAVELVEVRQDSDIADRKGTQPAKYHAGLSKSTKAARDRQFKKQTKMADNNPAAYKPAPGDKDAKTKPSKFTVAVKKMFGESYTAWTNSEPVEYAKHLEKTFGKPDEMTDSQLCWFSKDGFKRIVIKDEYILHGSPAPHYDFIYCYIDLSVPEKYATALAESSGSIMIDFLKNEVGARCGSITANATTLNYVLDVVAERVKPSKEEYEKRILGMRKMFENGETYTTDWWPDESKDADPKNKYYAEGHSAVCGCVINEGHATSRAQQAAIAISKKEREGERMKEYKMSMKPTKPLRFKKMFEKDAQDAAKKRIDREKERVAVRHDRMMDRARTRDTIAKNRETNPNDKVR